MFVYFVSLLPFVSPFVNLCCVYLLRGNCVLYRESLSHLFVKSNLVMQQKPNNNILNESSF